MIHSALGQGRGSLKTACATIAAFPRFTTRMIIMKKWLLAALMGIALAGCASSGDSDDLGIDPATGAKRQKFDADGVIRFTRFSGCLLGTQ